MKRLFPITGLLIGSVCSASPLYLECAVAGKSFDQKFTETVGIKIDDEMIDVVSEEFPMFGRVATDETHYRASRRFTNSKGVRYFFSIELDRVSGRFMAYETAAYPDRKIYNTTGTGPCTKISETRFAAIRPNQNLPAKQAVRVIIRRPGQD